MSGELLLIFMVALLVFPPQKWPMLIRHLARITQQIKTLYADLQTCWHEGLAKIQLAENNEKANDADKNYTI